MKRVIRQNRERRQTCIFLNRYCLTSRGTNKIHQPSVTSLCFHCSSERKRTTDDIWIILLKLEPITRSLLFARAVRQNGALFLSLCKRKMRSEVLCILFFASVAMVYSETDKLNLRPIIGVVSFEPPKLCESAFMPEHSNKSSSKPLPSRASLLRLKIRRNQAGSRPKWHLSWHNYQS